MFLVDTHTHIFSEEFDSDLTEVIQRAQDNGIRKFCLPNIHVDSIDRLHKLSRQFPDICFPMMGLHPTSVYSSYSGDLEIMYNELKKNRYIAIGEIGIDLYWDKTFILEQKAAFEKQLRWSIEMNVPVANHTQEAFPEVFESLRKVGKDRLRGVFHSFSGSREELEEALSFPNFMLGINGVITYKKANFREYLPIAPVERILLETDAPYLTPVPYRGKRNEPSFLTFTAQKVAEVYALPLETIARITTENAQRLFDI